MDGQDGRDNEIAAKNRRERKEGALIAATDQDTLHDTLHDTDQVERRIELLIGELNRFRQ